MSFWGSRLREIRLNKGLSQSELARAASVSNEYIGKIERGESTNVGTETVEAIAKALSVHPTEILYGIFGQTLLAGRKFVEENGEFSSDFYDIPLLTGAVEAGAFTQNFSEWSGATLKVPVGMYKGRDLISWKIKGRSMEPHYLDGDVVIISKVYECIDGIDVIARKNGDHATIKKIKTFPDGTIELRPYNSDFPTIQVQHSDEVEIVGKIVGLFRDMERKKR